MILNVKLTKQNNENDDQFIFRICAMKDSTGLTWQKIADIINEALGRNFTESAYRKKYQSFQNGLKTCEAELFDNDKYLNELRKQTEELYIAKKQMQDQRREYNKNLTSTARMIHLENELIKIANSLGNEKLLCDNEVFYDGNDSEALLILSDWHYGMVTDNIWNKFDTDICKQRVSKLLSRTKAHLRTHNVSTLHVVLLGDLFHGSIHVGCRVASEEDACDQLMHVSEILAEFLNSVSDSVNCVKVYSTYGNHARTIQNKNDSIHSDNMEKLIPWWLRPRLQKNNKIELIDNNTYEFVCLNILGHDIVCVHGDLDRFNKLVSDMGLLFKKQYDMDIEYIFSADKHHDEFVSPFGVHNTLVGSLCGTDEFANNHRLYSDPTQLLCLFNKSEGKYCTYPINLK